MSANTLPSVTIIVVPRERFSHTRESLESIYQYTDYPFQLIYIDGGSPREIRDYLATQAEIQKFTLQRTDYYLSPNQARNLGLNQVSSDYVVFLDNDVIVTPGWLTNLVNCAEETKAAIASPLICQGTPLHTEIHCAGGKSGVREENQGGRRRIIEKIHHQGRKVVDILPQLQRQTTGLAEFHCMLVRREIFDKIGSLDEKLLNTKEHIDLCMQVAQVGGEIYLEPTSLVTYVPGKLQTWADIHYYMLRWSDGWELASLQHLQNKWQLTEDEYFQNKYKRLGWRRNATIIYPLLRKLPLGKFSVRVVGKILRTIDKILNYFIGLNYIFHIKRQRM
ncbi:glycosyltransferase family 2 protein [Calothrix sp. 336/3]|uniref:glycosyltransferase family 2 protein n=1 Tax=Calothrix sp. 336/3 TaxID=1337936 RepID=UPI0004E2F198|nr:glycosyltransferase [Calothrix sp. 336/3]AKG20912.1 glycosyl transferase family 2 [Calothrix sp. 336/3]